MKRLAALAAVFAVFLLAGGVQDRRDVGQLEPIGLLQLTETAEGVTVQADTGAAGSGATVGQALSAMQARTAAVIFLETAETVLIPPGKTVWIGELAELLHPSCAVCIAETPVPTEEAAAYLRAHPIRPTLGDCMAGETVLPVLRYEKGAFRLVS